MAKHPHVPVPPPPSPIAPATGEETTGKFVITFREGAVSEGLSSLKKHAGVTKMASAADFDDSAMDLAQIDEEGGAVFPSLGIAVVTLDEAGISSMATVRGVDSAILDIEPERFFYTQVERNFLATGDFSLPLAYLRGYRDAVNHLYDVASTGMTEEGIEAVAAFLDDAQSTWGLKATNVVNSQFTGRGIKVAVLDTGFDLQHPDFLGRAVTPKSFVPTQGVQDGNGHGTHCIGTSCGGKSNTGRRYGIASDAAIFVGKVLSNAGSGPTSGILAGMEWAVTSKCHVISMSLGNEVATSSTAYETAGRRALELGCLIVAAAGNHGEKPPPGNTVGQPANSPSILAVAAVDNRLRRASFSAVSGTGSGAKVDIAGPGVNVFSSVPMPKRYDGTFSGTSMATPHVAGIAALWAQAKGARGNALWQLVTSHARSLSANSSAVGVGLVQAP